MELDVALRSKTTNKFSILVMEVNFQIILNSQKKLFIYYCQNETGIARTYRVVIG